MALPLSPCVTPLKPLDRTNGYGSLSRTNAEHDMPGRPADPRDPRQLWQPQTPQPLRLARPPPVLDVPFHPDFGLLAQCRRRVLCQADPPPSQTRRLSRLVPTACRREDAFGVGGPDERLWALVVVGEGAFDRGLEVDQRMLDSTRFGIFCRVERIILLPEIAVPTLFLPPETADLPDRRRVRD